MNWQRDTSVGCADEDTDSTTITGGSMTSYTITGLEEDSRYAVTVTASNTSGDRLSNTVTAMTEEAGERLSTTASGLLYGPLSHSSICPSA